MKRRDFVRGLAVAPVAMMVPNAGAIGNDAAQSADVPSADGTAMTLNIVVHGAFVIAVDKSANQICLKAPLVDGHSYVAQAFQPDPHDPNGVLQAWKQDYEVKSQTLNDEVVLTPTYHTKLSYLGTGDPERIAVKSNLSKKMLPYWNVTLPMPDEIWGLRATCYNYFDSSGNSVDSYHANEMNGTQHCPISYVLTYENIGKGTTVTFSGNKQTVCWDSKGVGRLHFYAEPPIDPPQDSAFRTNKATTAKMKTHLDMSLNALNSLFASPFELKFIAGIDPDEALGYIKADDQWFQGHPSVRPCEQLSLAERLKAQSQGGGCLDNIERRTIQDQCAGFQEFQNLVIRQSLGERKAKETRVPPTKPPRNCMPIIKIP